MDNLTKQLAQEYNLNLLRQEAEDFARPVDREKYREISKRHAKIVRGEIRNYERDYSKRLVQAGRGIAEDRGVDFDRVRKGKDERSIKKRKSLEKLAHRDVQNDHLRRIAVLRNQEAKELRGLIADVRQRENPSPPPEQKPEVKLLTDQSHTNTFRHKF